MSKLLIGASSPIAYAYYTERELGRPAPILESPVSYILLYDEVWFAHRNLCPFELDCGLPFVHFVNEQYSGHLGVEVPEAENRSLESWNWAYWEKVVDVTINAKGPWRWDNHARRVKIGGIDILPSPGMRAALYVDRILASTLGMRLAENSPNSIGSTRIDREVLKFSLSERLLNARFIAPRAPSGFWHPCLLNLREDKGLKAYRSKLDQLTPSDFVGLDAKVGELIAEYEREMRRTFKESMTKTGMVWSFILFITGLGLVPGLDAPNKIASGIDWIGSASKKIRAAAKNGWMAFLASVDEASEKRTLTGTSEAKADNP